MSPKTLIKDISNVNKSAAGRDQSKQKSFVWTVRPLIQQITYVHRFIAVLHYGILNHKIFQVMLPTLDIMRSATADIFVRQFIIKPLLIQANDNGAVDTVKFKKVEEYFA